eukprot:gene2580-5042_t
MSNFIGLPLVFILLLILKHAYSLREQRTWSTRSQCDMAKFINWPFAYSKYLGQHIENKGRVNTNLQDFRHECRYQGGRSKCHICEEIACHSQRGSCSLQLQGISSSDMSINVPVLSDFAWPIGGAHKTDYGGPSVSHYCVITRGENCTVHSHTDFTKCNTRCFGYGFTSAVRPVPRPVLQTSIVDIYPGQGKWVEDGLVDLWEYPRNCSDLNNAVEGSCTLNGPKNVIPSFNPQGFTLTLAGTGKAGFKDGASSQAQFNFPSGIAVDKQGYVYVADTLNHAIREISPAGMVRTIAGQGASSAGYVDGACTVATFSSPKGVDMKYITTAAGVEHLIIMVADTGNHRIRQIDYVRSTGFCQVSCFSGLCGNDTLSETLFHHKATPRSGYADGPGGYARFSAPEGIAIMDNGYMAVADTGNYLIRWLSSNGTTWTLAGNIGEGQKDADGKPLAGCPPPCLQGIPGRRDGDLTSAQFLNPTDVARGVNNSIYVTDEQRVRVIELPNLHTTMYSIQSQGRVSTIAGTGLQGYEDGIGQESTFFDPSSVVVTSDNIAYVTDSATCRIRRITPAPLVAQSVSCVTDAVSLIRPSGCTSFDPPIDETGRKISRVESNIQYNYGWSYDSSSGAVHDIDRGKFIKNCVGVPPLDRLQKHFVAVEGDNLVIDDHRVFVNEDSEQGMTILVRCPGNCGGVMMVSGSGSGSGLVEGNDWYSDRSSVCRAAVHSGKITSKGGLVQITLERRAYLWKYSNGAAATTGVLKNGITSNSIPDDIPRVYKVDAVNTSINIVHSIAGHPSAKLESGCGYKDAQPAQSAYFNKPRGIAAYINHNISDESLLYIADSGNHMIRCLSAVCTIICENGGRCVGPDKCSCPLGWSGVDCTIPTCTTTCGANRICVGPDSCQCKPGYGGTNCDVPQCIQTCLNGATCSAPDTCNCPPGWFDANCSTPVCSQTCGNGGNCTGPNTCACPSDWWGYDCRKPVCEQTCLNGGYCMAPNTCACPPQWTNYDCSVPVCTQGYFKPNPPTINNVHLYSNSKITWELYKPCDLESYCNVTREFECYQLDMTFGTIAVPYGTVHRAKTGRKKPPIKCMPIELPIDYKIPFELLKSDNTTTGYWRYAPNTQYTSNPFNPWRGYDTPVDSHSAPWTYTTDRQVALVQWLNASQGVYVCANNGNCTAPGICECAPGWMGFDCRTPICDQGYFFKDQKKFVSGLEVPKEVDWFHRHMRSPWPRLQWPYSNPNYTIVIEEYENQTILRRYTVKRGDVRYFGPSNWASGHHGTTFQGGYRCSIRSYTSWENVHRVFSHPNYYSRYMDRGIQHDGNYYTNWTNMQWPPVHQKSRILVLKFANSTFIYTNEGYRLYGIWNRTGNIWEYGTCIMEFSRNCSDASKAFDLKSQQYGVYVQDTDLSYRARVNYSDQAVLGRGWWRAAGGSCVDEVVRGCFNNGTCIAPNQCRCAPGWSGYDCSVPICRQTCHHNGNCTLPDTCTCEKGWTGIDCSQAMCAQECQNGGYCVAPDTCKCKQWPNEFVDGRTAQRPYYRKPNGDAQSTGWTGYDCGVPICVQGKFTYVAVDVPPTSPRYVEVYGRGGDGTLQCIDKKGDPIPRCIQFDYRVLTNSGTSFQTGCGHDPLDDGCCTKDITGNFYTCSKCAPGDKVVTEHTMYCKSDPVVISGPYSQRTDEKFAEFVYETDFQFKMCGRNYTPFDYWGGQPLYYRERARAPALQARYTNYNFKSNLTSNRFLCHVQNWTQGDYLDDANMSTIEGMGTIFGLASGRHVRVNNPNIIGLPGHGSWIQGERQPGEGIYVCFNSGSCIGPDSCTCEDGYTGDDCTIPLCRHLQPSGLVTSCLNGGICGKKDSCSCVKVQSVLALVHKDASRGMTGWTGSDCSMPICVQGYFDPFCTDLPQAPGGEGCYRCANGGNCTAPDVCKCAQGWTGFDCRTPVCELVATPLIRLQLGTVLEEKVIAFETDPCGVEAIYGRHGYHGYKYTRGNCTRPNQCTCLCYSSYDAHYCDSLSKRCVGAWQDPLVDFRDVLSGKVRTYGYTFGSTECRDGYEGEVDHMAHFTSCHMQVFIPSPIEEGSLAMIYTFSICGFFFCVAWFFIRRRLKQRYLMAKIERRRSRRSSEESLLHAEGGAFGHS